MSPGAARRLDVVCRAPDQQSKNEEQKPRTGPGEGNGNRPMNGSVRPVTSIGTQTNVRGRCRCRLRCGMGQRKDGFCIVRQYIVSDYQPPLASCPLFLSILFASSLAFRFAYLPFRVIVEHWLYPGSDQYVDSITSFLPSFNMKSASVIALLVAAATAAPLAVCASFPLSQTHTLRGKENRQHEEVITNTP